MTKPSSMNGQLAKWALLFSQYELQFLPQKTVKGQAVTDFLAKHPDPRMTKLYEDLEKHLEGGWIGVSANLETKCGN